MLRPDAHCGKVRNSDFVSVSHCAESAAQACGREGHVLRNALGTGQSFYRGRQVQSGKPSLSGGCRTSHAAFLVALSGQEPSQRNHASPNGNSASAGRRGGQNSWGMDHATERQGAVRELVRSSLGAIGTTLPTPDRVARIGTMQHRTRTTTLGLASPVTTTFLRSDISTECQADQQQVVSRICPSSENTLSGSAERRLLKYGKAELAF